MIEVRAGGKSYQFCWRHYPVLSVTQCAVFVDGQTSDGQFLFVDARCCPEDQFLKEVGRRVSLTRLLSKPELHFGKTQRARVWEAYWERLPSTKRPDFRKTRRPKKNEPCKETVAS